MEVNIQRTHVQGTPVIQNYNFGIKASAKAIELMISQLYKDRTAAFIRELATNAYEAHQMLGIEDEPFEVTLPNYLNPSFKIRDFGPGLSPDEIGNVYVMIFESTKTNSNEMGGCFGLGSKSPFAYSPTIQFGVISYNGGMKYCYSVYRNEEGFPTMSLLYQEPSTERTGVEISIPINRGDHNTVERKAREIYKWFKTAPKVTNSPMPFTLVKPTVVGTNFGHYSTNDVHQAGCRMGNIVYQIDGALCNLHGLSHYPIIVEFPIGALTPEPSREGLSYDKKTKRAIEEAFATIKKEFIAKIQPMIDKCPTYFEAVLEAQQRVQSSPVTLYELTWNGEKLNSRLGDLPDKVGMAKILDNYDKMKKGNVDGLEIRSDYIFIVLDKKCAWQQIIKQYVRVNNLKTYGRKLFICDEVYQGHKRDEFVKFFKIATKDLVIVSSVPYTPPPRQQSVGRSNKHLTKMFTWQHSNANSSCWLDATIDTKAINGYYVVYFNNKILVNGLEIAPFKLQELMNLVGYTGEIYGIKKDSVDKLAKLSNWTNFLDYARPLAYKAMTAASSEDAEAAAKIIQSFRYNSSTTHSFIEHFSNSQVACTQKDIIDAVAEYKKVIGLARMNYRVLAEIASEFFGTTLANIGSTRILDHKRYKTLLSIIESKFPLVSHVGSIDDDGVIEELVSYITLKGI